jgi:hypothetical protein
VLPEEKGNANGLYSEAKKNNYLGIARDCMIGAGLAGK